MTWVESIGKRRGSDSFRWPQGSERAKKLHGELVGQARLFGCFPVPPYQYADKNWLSVPFAHSPSCPVIARNDRHNCRMKVLEAALPCHLPGGDERRDAELNLGTLLIQLWWPWGTTQVVGG